MSLISDALKKARQEAARQDALRQSLPYAVGAAEAPKRNAFIPVLLGLGAGCLLAGAIFAVAYFAGWGPFDKPEPVQVAEAAPSPSPAAPAPVLEEQTPEPTPTPLSEPPPEPTPAPTATPAPIATPPPPIRPESAPPAAAATPEETRPSSPPALTPAPVVPAPPAPAPGAQEESKSYVREVPIPGGGTVTLNGIAFSADSPIAVLDNRVVGPGEVVQGFTVVEIQSNRVKLEGHGTVVYVSLK